MKYFKWINIGILVLLLMSACRGENTTVDTATHVPEVVETEALQTDVEGVEETPEETEALVDEPVEVEYEWTAPIEPEGDLARTAVSAEEQATFDVLAQQDFPHKNQLALAYTFGVTEELVDPIVATEAPTLSVGAEEEFWVMNEDTMEWGVVTAKLEAVSEHAYFWLDTSLELKNPNIQRAVDDFENIYAAARAVYGSEPSPGIDGDTHIYILHINPLSICDVTEETAHQCYILGYYASTHSLPTAVEAHSNQHEMFVMNMGRGVGGSDYNSTIIHEFRHMIESNYDRNEDGWAVEGTAMMAQTLIDDWSNLSLYASQFTPNTDIQLNNWSQSNSIPHYGKGYLFVRYIHHRMGGEAYSAWVQHPGRGFFILDEVLDEYGFEFSAQDLWLDWTVAVSLIGMNNVPDEYGFGEGLLRVDDPKRITANKAPMEFEEDVNQNAFDIFDVRSDAPVTVDFTGTTKVAVMPKALPASGQYMWFSGRANESSMTLTHEFDLSGVDSATLNYSVLYSIEKDWDFTYALVSTDGGETWETLIGENMESDEAGDDPGELSLADYYYTGLAREWEQESIDLTSFTGQVILIRFQLVTDLMLTNPGIMVDNISIPEIGYYDDVETLDEDWEVEGFTRVTAYEPQRFHLILVRFEDDGTPVVEWIAVADDNTAVFEIPFTADNRRAFLIVAASNPIIMTPALYQLTISQ